MSRTGESLITFCNRAFSSAHQETLVFGTNKQLIGSEVLQAFSVSFISKSVFISKFGSFFNNYCSI